MAHKFTVGQTIDLVPSVLRFAAAGSYEILRLMPSSDGEENPRYRIRSKYEKHDRIVPESDMLLALPPETIFS